MKDVITEMKKLLDFIDGKEPEDGLTRELAGILDLLWRRRLNWKRNCSQYNNVCCLSSIEFPMFYFASEFFTRLKIIEIICEIVGLKSIK